jgi:hypothetical protein
MGRMRTSAHVRHFTSYRLKFTRQCTPWAARWRSGIRPRRPTGLLDGP